MKILHPIYKEEMVIPDGATEKEVDEIIDSYMPANKATKTNEDQNNEIEFVGPGKILGPLSTAAISFMTGKSYKEAKKPYESPNEILSDAAAIAPFFLAPQGKLATQAAKVALANGGSTLASQLLNGKTLKQSSKEAAESAALGGSAHGLLSGAGRLFSKAKEPISKGISKIGSIASSVPEDEYKLAADAALSGKSIFNSSSDMDKRLATQLADKAREGVKYLANQQGKKVGTQKQILKDKALVNEIPMVNTKDITSSTKNRLKSIQDSTGLDSLKDAERRDIQNFNSLIENNGNELPVDRLNTIKLMIEDKIYENTHKTGRMSQGDGILAQMASELNSKIEKFAPNLAEENKNYSNLVKAQDFVFRKLNDPNTKGSALLGSIKRDNELGSLLDNIESQLPDKLKFLDEARKINARNSFSKLTPGQGGGYGSDQGAMNQLKGKLLSVAGTGGAAGVLSGSPILGGALAGAAASAFSPAANKVALQGISKAINGYGAISSKVPAFASKFPISEPDGQTDPAWLQKIRQSRGLY